MFSNPKSKSETDLLEKTQMHDIDAYSTNTTEKCAISDPIAIKCWSSITGINNMNSMTSKSPSPFW